MRFEFKYSISNSCADDFFLRLKSFFAQFRPEPGLEESYKILSLYFDDKKMSSYWDKKNGQSVRHKIRLRQYDDASALYAEKKSSVGIKRWKVRAPTALQNFEGFMEKWHESPHACINPETLPQAYAHRSATPLDEAVYCKFNPMAWVEYQRKSVTFSNLLRLSLDTRIAVARYLPLVPFARLPAITLSQGVGNLLTIVEFKFPKHTDEINFAMAEIERFHVSNSKYCLAIDAVKGWYA